MKLTKSRLAIILSQLKTFETQKVRAEQYSTDSEVAASILWTAYENGDIENKEILDLGAGTGILGLGTMIMGAKKVTFIDGDIDALNTLRINLKKIQDEYDIISEYDIIHDRIENYNSKSDTIIMNPPFGTKIKHADKEFILKAFQLSRIIYSLHKSETKDFISSLAQKNGFNITHILDFSYPIKATLKFHKSRIRKINVSMFRFLYP